MAEPVYFETSMFIEIGTKGSPHRASLRNLLKNLQDAKVKIYTSILTVQEMGVASHRKGTLAKDVAGDISSIAKVASITKEMALTAAKLEAQLKDLSDEQERKRDKSKPLGKAQEIERICGNRRRKWDCLHIATAQALGCSVMYSTDEDLQKRPKLLGIKSLKIVPPSAGLTRMTGPIIDFIEERSE